MHGLFGAGMRAEIGGNLIRLAAVLEPLAELGADDAHAADGADAPPRGPARLTCLSLPDGPRDVAADLAAALIVQWATRSVADESGFRPAVILAGADEQSTRHLSRLTTVCERYEVPLVRMFSRLTEESSRHLDSRHTAFMRLATRPEALRAAEHIGLERKFVAGRFSHRQSVSRSRTKTSTESTTHTTGRAEGEATTHTTGTTTGQMYSEAQVPRHDTNVNVHVHANGNGGGNGNAESDSREAFRARVARERRRPRRPSPVAAASGQQAGRGGGTRQDQATKDASGGKRPEGQAKSGGGWVTSGGSGGGKPVIDTVKTRTWFNAEHTSDSKTQSVTNTEETSHTRSESRSVTDGTSVGDEISFELVYDHRVQPETLMALPEDQMLAPHVVRAPPPRPPCQVPRTPARQPTRSPRARRVPRAGWSPSSSTRRSSAPTRWQRSPRTKSRPTSPPPPRSPRTSRPTSAPPSAPPIPPTAASARPRPLGRSPAHHSFLHTPRRLSSRDRNSSATQTAPVISPPTPSKTTMSTNEASQLDVMCRPPKL